MIAIAADSRSVQVAVDMFADGKATDSGASGPTAAARRDRGNMTEFQFQHVFQPHTTQAQVYDRIVEHGGAGGGSMLDQLFEGKNCSILAYGQTGTGKSWSMEGPSTAMLAAMSPASVAAASLAASLDGSEEPESESAYSLRGLIPRLVEAIFRRLQEQHQAATQGAQASQAEDASSMPASPPSADPLRPSSAPASFSSASGGGGTDLDVSVQISFFELYRGKIRDLLAGGKSVYEVEDSVEPSSGASSAPLSSPLSSPTSAGSAASAAPGSSPLPATTARALQLQMKDKQVVVVGLSERSLRDSRSVLRALKEGQRHRTVARTNANAWSSRGHAIFDVSLRQTIRKRVAQDGQEFGEVPSRTIVSRLRLVDLAGSEQHVESGVESARLEEARSINRSLTFLGKVITSLSQREKHISYRDALLTRLLSQSLGGNCTTTLLITASPARASLKKTLNTLRFGAGATSILNAVSVNSRRRPGSVAMNYAIPALPLSAIDEWEEGQCWARLQTVQKRDGALKCVPVDWVRTLVPAEKRKERRTSGTGLIPGSPQASPTAPSKENIEAVHALSSEVDSLRKSLNTALSQAKLAEGARASAQASAALTTARLRDLEANSRALLGLLNKIGVIRAAQRVQSIHDASTPGSNLLSAPVDSVQSLVDDLLAAPADKDAGPNKLHSSLKALKKLIQFFPVDCSVDGSSAGTKAIRSPLASPTRSRSASSTRASPSAAPRSASSTRSAPAAKAEDGAIAEKLKQLEAKNAALASELAAAKRAARSKTPVSALARDMSPAAKSAVLPSAEQAALQSELDASYREITRVNAENAALQSQIKALRHQKQLKPSAAAATAAGAVAAPAVIVSTPLPALSSIEELHLSDEQKEQLNAQVEARVAAQTAELREQLAVAQEQARAASETAAAVSSAAVGSPQPQQVNRQLFPSDTPAAAPASTDAVTAAEIEARVESLLAERTQQLHHDLAEAQAAWLASKEREWGQLQETFQADVQAQQMQMHQYAMELQQQAEAVMQQRNSIDLDRTLHAAMQDSNATATARSPSSAAASYVRSGAALTAASADDTAELAAALSDQVAAEKSAFIVELRSRIAEEQRLWASALTSEHGALLRREIGEEAAAFDARFRHLEFSLSARVDSVAQQASRQLHEHHLALQTKERQMRQKLEQEYETRKIEWQHSAVQNFQQQQREEQSLRSAGPASSQRDPDTSPLSPTRGASVDPTLPLQSLEHQTSVRLALSELEKADLEAREGQVREWKLAVETQEAKQREYAAQQGGSGDEEQRMQDQSDLVRKMQADAAALLESERAAHAAALESHRQSSASEVETLVSQRLSVELERLRDRFSLEKLDWMDRSKRNLDATVAEQVAQERSKIEARMAQTVQERVVVELERSKAALKIEQAARWDSALREQASIQTAAHQSQIDTLSLQLASMQDRWEERERAFSRMMADQSSKAKEEVRRMHLAFQQREADARARAEAEISAMRATVDTAQIRADDSKALALQVEYLAREAEFQTSYQAFVQQQWVEPLTKENQALKDQLQMITLIQQQTQHEQRFSPPAQPPSAQQHPQNWTTSSRQGSHTHTRKRLDYVDHDDSEEEKQQPPPTPSPRIFGSSPAVVSATAPNTNSIAGRAVTTPSKHELERREIKAQIAQLEDQLVQVKSPPLATSAKKRSPRASSGKTDLGTPSRHTLRVDSIPQSIVTHMESADRSDYPFGSAVAKSMQLVDRLHVHQAAEQAIQHLEAADAELNASSLATAATVAAAAVGSAAAASPSPAASLASSASARTPSIPAALDISLLEGDLYTQHLSYLSSAVEGVREVSEMERRNARESERMERELLNASAMMREALAPASSVPTAAPAQSDAARQQDEQLAQMQAELRQTQAAIQQLVAAAAAAQAPQLVDPSPTVVAAAASPVSSSPGSTAPDLPAEVRAMISGLKNELGETNKLLQSERASRLAAAATAAEKRSEEEEDRKLDATLSAHALIHSVPTPPLSPIAGGTSPWFAGPAPAPAPSPSPSAAPPTSTPHAMYRVPSIQPTPFRGSASPDFAATIARETPVRTELASSTSVAAAASPSSLDDSFTARSEELRAAEQRTEQARRRVQTAVHAVRTSHGDGSMRAPLVYAVPPPAAATHSFASSRWPAPVVASAPPAVSARSHLQHLQLPFGSALASSPRWSPASDAWPGIRR